MHTVTWKLNAASFITYPVAFLLGKWALSILGLSVTWGQYWGAALVILLAWFVANIKITLEWERLYYAGRWRYAIKTWWRRFWFDKNA